MTAFATVSDYEKRAGAVPDDLKPLVETGLEDAAAELRDLIGQEVWPRREISVTLTPGSGGRVFLPQIPVIEVASVVDRNGNDVEVLEQDGASVTVGRCVGPVTVTYTFGYEDPPLTLVKESCAMVATTMRDLDLGVGATGDVQTVAIDDFRITFKQVAIELLRHHEKQLQKRYGNKSRAIVVITS